MFRPPSGALGLRRSMDPGVRNPSSYRGRGVVTERAGEATETTGCILCRSGPEDPVVLRENGYECRRCRSCGLIYLWPRASAEEVVNLYGHGLAQISAEEHRAAAPISRLRARHHLRILRAVCRSGDLLEIGAGAGFFLEEARRLGYSPHAIELNPVQAAFIRDTLRIPCETSPLSTASFGGRRFDLLYHADVMSHFREPQAEIERMHGALKPGGCLVFETGNLADVDERYFRVFDRFQLPDHLFFFGVRHLEGMLARAGFVPLRTYRYSLLPQLAVLRAMRTARRWTRRTAATAARNDTTPDPGPGAGPARHAWGLVHHLLRYEIGRFPLGSRVPQTVLVVARRSGQAPAPP